MINSWSEGMIRHIGTKTWPRLLREAKVGNSLQGVKAWWSKSLKVKVINVLLRFFYLLWHVAWLSTLISQIFAWVLVRWSFTRQWNSNMSSIWELFERWVHDTYKKNSLVSEFGLDIDFWFKGGVKVQDQLWKGLLWELWEESQLLTMNAMSGFSGGPSASWRELCSG